MDNKVLKAIQTRRSCRSFMPGKKVDDDCLNAVLQAAAMAPSAMNTQSWHFTAITSEDKLTALNTAMLKRMDSASRARAEGRANGRRVSPFYNAPAFIIVSLKKGVSPYPEADAACAMQNMFLAAYSLGLGTCWINQLRGACVADEFVGSLLKEFGVPADNEVYACCALGYADKESVMPKRADGTINVVK